jgi:hypothetical protein
MYCIFWAWHKSACSIWSFKDLPPLLSRRPELFANKFFEDFQPVTLDCLEEWYWNRTAEDYLFNSYSQSQQISHFPQFHSFIIQSGKIFSNNSFSNAVSNNLTIALKSSKHISNVLVYSRINLTYYSSLDVVKHHL